MRQLAATSRLASAKCSTDAVQHALVVAHIAYDEYLLKIDSNIGKIFFESCSIFDIFAEK